MEEAGQSFWIVEMTIKKVNRLGKDKVGRGRAGWIVAAERHGLQELHVCVAAVHKGKRCLSGWGSILLQLSWPIILKATLEVTMYEHIAVY